MIPRALARVSLAVATCAAAVVFLLYKISFFFALQSYVHYLATGEDYFSEKYLNPTRVAVAAPSRYRNLLLIYVESLEDTYSNRTIFSRDLLHSVDVATIRNASRFDRYVQAPGTNWTIAGIVATQCGIPLKLLAFMPDSKNRFENHVGGFLNHAVCLGDILAGHGYRNIFMNGSELSFAGMGKFMANHGYAESYGRPDWYRNGKTDKDMNNWGLYDDELFAIARNKIDELETSGGGPFNLTLLTVDTHGYDGTLSQGCANRGVTDGDFEGIVECTAWQVRELLEYLDGRGYLENMAVVVLGDHLAMENRVYEKLLQEPHRSIFNLFVVSDGVRPNRGKVNGFDMFPTMLYALGFRFDGGQLALGFSGFGTFAVGPDPGRDGELQGKLLGFSKSYSALWE